MYDLLVSVDHAWNVFHNDYLNATAVLDGVTIATLSNKRVQDVTDRVYWSTSTPDVVKISPDGTLLPLKKGIATFTAKYGYGGRTASIKVLVLDENGVIQAISAGKTTIKAMYAGKDASTR